MANEGAHTFFLYVLMSIVFMSAIIGILQHYKILPFIIKYIGFVLSKINGMGKLESYNAVAAAIVGQNEVFISVKIKLAFTKASTLYLMCFCDVNGIDVHCGLLYDDARAKVCSGSSHIKLVWWFYRGLDH